MSDEYPASGLWDRQEAWDYLNKYHYYMEEMSQENQDRVVAKLMAMKHRPHCRTHMASIAPEYGSECTCDGKYLESASNEQP